MSTTRLTFCAAALLATLTVAAPEVGRAQDTYVTANAIGPRAVNFDMFYQELSPYGSWVQCEPYGWIWMPSGVDPSWQPYTTGYWSYSAQYGYAWYADEVWGWAPFHYGNWIYTPSYGWAWIPGYTWSAAWVSWRYGAGYVAWAPLPPRYYNRYGYGYGYNNYGYGYGYGNGYYGNGHPRDNHNPGPDVRNDVATTVDPKHYVVVPEGNFQDTHVTNVMRRDVAQSSEFNNVKQVERLPTLARRNAPPGATTAATGNQTINSRVDSPGARDIARVDRGDISGARQLDASRTLESNPTRELESNRVREMGRDSELRVPRDSGLPRLSPTPRLPQVGTTNPSTGNGGYYQPGAQPRMNPSMPSSQPRVMPSMPHSAPSYAPRSGPSYAPRALPSYTPRPSNPVMRATPAPHPTFRAAPSSGGGRIRMPSGRPRR